MYAFLPKTFYCGLSENPPQPADFPNPHTINVARNIPSTQGLGLHKCPALSFVDQVGSAKLPSLDDHD